MAQYLSVNSMMTFLEVVNRDNANEKINGLLSVKKDLIDEMKHLKFLMTNVPFNLDETFMVFRWLVLFCAFIINFLLLFDNFTEECVDCLHTDPILEPCVCGTDTPTQLGIKIIYYLIGEGIKIFVIVLFGCNVFTFLLWAVLKLKLDLSNAFN